MESVSYSTKPNIGKSPSMYDDVLTSSQKFSSNSLAPRLEDYAEIFGGFHGSRGRSSSIPVLDLPPLDPVDLLAVSSSDYSDVFTGFHGLQFAVSFQDLLTQANNAGYDSSDQAWSPAHSGSLSDETDPSAFSERSQSTSTGDIHHSVNGINQFNLSYHKAHQRSDGDVTAGMTHVTHLHAVPGYTCIVEEKVESENSKDEKRLYQGINDPNYKEDYGMRVADDKSYTENLSLPVNNNFQKRGSRLNRWETRSKSGPILNEPLITVSDISLRTRPSHLPPPSRPPPVLAFGKREHEITHLKPKTSRSMSVASLEDALCRTEGNVTKDEGLQTFMNLQMEDDIKYWSCHKDGRESYTETPFDFGNNTAGHADQWSQAEVTLLGTRKERKETMNTREVGSDGIYGEIEINSNEKSWKEKKHRKNRTSSLGSYKNEEIGLKNEEIGLWREAAEYFEVETDYCSKYYKDSKEKTIGNKDKKSFGDQWDRKAATKQNKSCEKDELAEMAPEREEKQDILYKGESSVEYVPEEGRSRESSRSIFQMEDKKSVQVIIGIIEPETSKEEQRVVDEEIKKVLYTAESMETSNEDDSQHENVTDTDLDRKLASERTERVSDANSEKGNEMVSEEVFEIDHLMNRNYESEKTDLENKVKDIQDIEEREKLQNELLRRPKKMQKGTHVRLGPKTSELVEQKDEDCSIRHVCNQVDVHHVHDQYKKGSQFSLTREEENNMVNECHKLEEKEMELQRSCKQDNFGTEQREAHQFENGEKLGAGPGTKFYEMRSLCEEGSQSNSTEASVVIMKKNMGEDTCLDETSTQKAKKDELKKNVTNEGSDRSRTSTLETNEKLTDDVPSMEEVFRPVKGRLNMPDKNLGFSRQVNNSKIAANTVEQVHPVSPTASINVSEKPFNNVAKILPHTVASDHQVKVTYPKAQRAECIAGMQVTVDDKVQMEKLKKPQLASEWVDNAKNISDALQTVLVDIGDIRDGYETKSTQGTETKANNVRVKTSRNDGELKHENLVTTKEEKKRQKEREKDVISKTEKAGGHDEHLKRSEEEREREREREKDRTAVENTNREARGRAYNDARERAALERATSEARQRAMAEARERLEKASAEAREARIKAERAAVERATAEARQRAFEKVKAAKCNPEANDRLYRAADKSASKEMKQSGPTNDLYNIQRQNELRDTNSSAQGVEGESPQRCKARMERYQRTAERAAKALAEKNMRDFVAQREQEERARLAEVLDADVKRWSSGKQGNLRALLSTLQYILGPDSGWQPIPLTEVITSAAVKKVYRKATLCVHPDKLQQRGANTQQKYICEKVFDLLKEAWNKFNSEER